MPLVTAGMIKRRKNKHEKGDPMIFMKLSDYADSIENVIFPKIFEKYASIIAKETASPSKATLHPQRRTFHTGGRNKGDEELKFLCYHIEYG